MNLSKFSLKKRQPYQKTYSFQIEKFSLFSPARSTCRSESSNHGKPAKTLLNSSVSKFEEVVGEWFLVVKQFSFSNDFKFPYPLSCTLFLDFANTSGGVLNYRKNT